MYKYRTLCVVKVAHKKKKQSLELIKLMERHIILTSATTAMRLIRKSFHKDIEHHVIFILAASRISRLNKSNVPFHLFNPDRTVLSAVTLSVRRLVLDIMEIIK